MTHKHRLELMWPDKEKIASPEPRVLLEKEVFQSSLKGQKGSKDNLLIYGDNLLGLKALERDYAGKVKCIYIDPPYNTKSCFIHYDDSMEHSLWLNMMKDRLLVMYRLLSEDGSIWISIDDGECHYLKVMCDEIFGRRNFISNIIWQHSLQGKGYSNRFSVHHNHVLIYRKTPNFKLNNLVRSTEDNKNYSNPDNDTKGAWRSGDVRNSLIRPNLMYDITTPSGKIIRHPEKGWRFSKTTFEQELNKGKIKFSSDDSKLIRKIYLSEQDGRVPETLWLGKDVGTTREATSEVKQFNPKDIFQTPKPERLINRILHLATNPGDIVLDSFAGSGTTGAVAHKMGRRWIMIELNPHCHTHIVPRLQKVIDGTDQGGITEAEEWKGGGGFRLCEPAPSLLERNRVGRWVISKKYNPIQLAEAVCLHADFQFNPRRDPWWIHGQSTERDFIYVTSSTLTSELLKRLSEQVGEDRTLLVYCEAFHGKSDEYPNLTIEKIPKKILARCEWGRDDYSLKIQYALETEAELANSKKQPKSAEIRASVAAKSVRRRAKK
jgi:adenine-specific DNA-methyltransferase